MRTYIKTDFEIGNNDIPISIYVLTEKEIGAKQLSKCCNKSVNYRKVCSNCEKQLSTDDIYKAVEIGKDKFKAIDSDKLKIEGSCLKLLGVVDNDSEDNGFIRDGLTWFITPTEDKKNKSTTSKTLTKFSYLRETLKTANKSFLCFISTRGKEHLVLVKPYKSGFIGVGIHYAETIRDTTDNSVDNKEVDKEMLKTMVKSLEEKPKVSIEDFKNKRAEILEAMLTAKENREIELTIEQQKAEEEKAINPTELLNF